MPRNEQSEQLSAIGEQTARTTFTADFQRRTSLEQLVEQGLGIALSRWSGWDGLKLLRVLYSALEDSNFHKAAEQVQEIIEREKRA